MTRAPLFAAAILLPLVTAATPKLGINTNWVDSWCEDHYFADMMLHSRQFNAPGVQGTLATVDARGPTQDCDALVIEGTPRNVATGSYSLRFVGQATLGGATITNQSYNSETNVTTASVAVTQGSPLTLTFRDTRRVSTDSPGTGLRDITLMRPGHVLGTDVFNQAFVGRISIFTLIRPMNGQWGGNNPANTTTREWSERPLPSLPLAGKGLSYEHLALMATELGKDVWINIPHYGSADVVLKIAQALRYGISGADGLPYDSAYGGGGTRPAPASFDPKNIRPDLRTYPPVPASRILYVEYGNELWNWAFTQAHQSRLLAIDEVAAGDPNNFAYDGSADSYTWAIRRYAYKTMWVSDIFRTVWGADNNVRALHVGSYQIGMTYSSNQAYDYEQVVWGGWANSGQYPTTLTTPEDGRLNSWGHPARPISYRMHSHTGAPYISRVSNIATMIGYMDNQHAVSVARGLRMVTYESGPESWLGVNNTSVRDLILEVARRFATYPNADYFNHFCLVADTQRWQSAHTYYAGEFTTAASGYNTYRSLQDGNLNHALTDAAWWVLDNTEYAGFGLSQNYSQTTNARWTAVQTLASEWAGAEPPPAPTISGFAPTSGEVGATVTIAGTNFDPTPASNTVMFNGTPATVTAASAASLTTTVPTGATTGPITVTVEGQTATSVGSFTVSAPPAGTGRFPGRLRYRLR